jgi:hypothetical protein
MLGRQCTMTGRMLVFCTKLRDAKLAVPEGSYPQGEGSYPQIKGQLSTVWRLVARTNVIPVQLLLDR